jgi:hypothetical protein
MLEGSGLEEKATNDEQDRPAEEAITSPRCASSPDPMFSNRIIEPYRKGTDKMINRDKSSISPINRG